MAVQEKADNTTASIMLISNELGKTKQPVITFSSRRHSFYIRMVSVSKLPEGTTNS